jgi:hypothetical protein
MVSLKQHRLRRDNPARTEISGLYLGRVCHIKGVNMGENRWPGFIDRNELTSFCQNEAVRLNAEISDLWDAMQNKKIDDDAYESLFAKHYMSLGKVLGLRQIMEFCAQHKKTEEEMESENA